MLCVYNISYEGKGTRGLGVCDVAGTSCRCGRYVVEGVRRLDVGNSLWRGYVM